MDQPPDKLALFALHSVPGIGSALLRRLANRFGRVAQVLDAAPLALAQVPRVTGEMIGPICALSGHLNELRRRLDSLEAAGFSMAMEWHGTMPDRLRALAQPPAVLYIQGRLPDTKCCAIVGATAPSRLGLRMARDIASRLAEAGWTIVSGYARGIDTAGHAGALAGGGSTVLFLPMGVDQFRLCPELAPWAAELGRRIVVASEAFPASPWSTAYAMARNRLVAGVSDALLVVEAEAAGGTMATFGMAQQAGVPTFAVEFGGPGPRGNQLAIERGAAPIRGPQDADKILAARPRDDAEPQAALWR